MRNTVKLLVTLLLVTVAALAQQPPLRVTQTRYGAAVATPSYNPDGGSGLANDASVTVTDSTPSSSILTCMDTANSCTPTTAYGGAITVTPQGLTTYLRSYATATGYDPSAVKSASYTYKVDPILSTPTLPYSGAAGSLSLATTSTTGAAIHYNTTGPTASCSDTLYSSPISVSSTTTYYAVGCKSNYTDSNQFSGTYTVSGGGSFAGPALLDNFDSYTAWANLSGSWTCATGTGFLAPWGDSAMQAAPVGTGNQVGPGGGGSGCYWNAATFGPAVEIAWTLTPDAPTTNWSAMMCLRYNTSTNQGYCLHLGAGATATPMNWYIIKDNPWDTTTPLTSGTQTIAVGDKVGFKASGSTISAWIYHSGVWTQVLTTTDASYDGSGSYNRIVIAGASGDSGVWWDDFSGATQ